MSYPRSLIFWIPHDISPAYYDPLRDEGIINTGDFFIWLREFSGNDLLSRSPLFHGLTLAYAEELVVHHLAQMEEPSKESTMLVQTASEEYHDIYFPDNTREEIIRQREVLIEKMAWRI